jgi:type III pantothenate kinase
MEAASNAARSLGLPGVEWLRSEPSSGGPVLLVNGYRDPGQLGADRWHAMLAARAAHPGRALVIVNAGTATTVDCVDAGGRFVGGVIAPGVALMFESLARQTAQLPRARGAFVARPDNTDDAITTGVLDSQLGLIERRVRRLAAEAGPVLLLLDGGHAAALRPHLAFDPALATLREEPNLVLRGVLVRARAQRAAARG